MDEVPNEEIINDSTLSFGTLEFTNGGKYIGQIKNDEMNGHGMFIYSRADNEALDYYNGTYKNGLKDGKGKLVWKDGQFYDGQWKDGKRNGFGKEIYGDHDSYEGYFKDNIRSGHGKYTWASGAQYVGNFENGDQNGKGTFFYKPTSNIFKYEGDFLNDQNHGNGK